MKIEFVFENEKSVFFDVPDLVVYNYGYARVNDGYIEIVFEDDRDGIYVVGKTPFADDLEIIGMF